MDYFNPAAGLPDPNTSANMPGGGFWTGAMQGLNQQTLAPFRANALSQQDIALKEAQMKFQEASDPAAVAARKQKIAAGMATDTGTIAEQPSKTAYNIEQHNQHFKLLGPDTQAKIAEAGVKINEAKGKPMEAVYNALSDMAPSIHSAPPAMKPMLWQSKLAELQAQYPDTPIPEDMKQWSPENEEKIQHLFMGRVHNVAETQKKEVARAAKEANIEVERMRAASNERMAATHASATRDAASIRANIEKPVNQNQYIVQLKKEVRAGKEGSEELLKQELNDAFSKQPEVKPILDGLSVAYATNNKDAIATGEVRLSQKKQAYFQAHGIKSSDRGGATATLPPQARAQLKEGTITSFKNGQSWTLENDQPKQVK